MIGKSNIRIEFERAMNLAINEGRARTIEGMLIKQLEAVFKSRGSIKNKGKNLKDIRFQLSADQDVAVVKITNAFKDIGNVSIRVISPGDYENGATSGTFYTTLVTFNEDIISLSIKKNDVVKIVNQVPPKGSITAKSLTPVGLRLTSDYMNLNTLKSNVNNAIQHKFSDNKYMRGVLTNLFEIVSFHEYGIAYESANEIKEFNALSIPYNEELIEAFESLGQTDVNMIGKDFGEILGAVMLLNMTKTVNGISFPSGNNPLIDFYIDGFGISSKYKKGASPTLSSITKNLDKSQFVTSSEIKMFDVLKIAQDNDTISGYIKIAKYMQTPAYFKLVELTQLKSIDKKSISKYVDAYISEFGIETFFNEIVMPFNKFVGRGHTVFSDVEWKKVKDSYGLLTYSLTMDLVDVLNKSNHKNELKTILSKLDVRQLYLDINLKKNKIVFHLRKFQSDNNEYEFDAKISTYSPSNAKLAFKLV